MRALDIRRRNLRRFGDLQARGRWALLILLLSLLSHTTFAWAAPPTAGSRQIVVVLADGWDDLHATLQRYQRASASAPWQPVGAAVPCVLGHKGLAWGRGIAPAPQAGLPNKAEGDKKAPAGIFPITGIFGFAAKASAFRMPYMRITEPFECVDDARSRSYNRVVDGHAVPHDWTSSERMRHVREYQWGAFIGHNIGRPLPGAGSCIFLHIWDSADEGTAGCTALEQGKLLEVLAWLRPEDRPLLVQMPRQLYSSVRGLWGLP